jgi:alanine dehydrogenase
MEQSSSWEANSRSVSQENPAFYGIRKIYYYVCNRPSVVPILSQINTYHTFQPNVSKVHSNNIDLPSTALSCRDSNPRTSSL